MGEASRVCANGANVSVWPLSKIIILLLAVFYATCVNIGHKYTRIKDNRIQSTFDQVTAVSAVDCCAKCNCHSSCMSVNFWKATRQCELSSVALKDVAAESDVGPYWVTYSRTDPADWIVAFHGIADIVTDMYEAWVNAKDVTTNDVNCMLPDATSCYTHFRSPLLDLWQSLKISEVKLSLYKNQTEVAYILFDGTGSSFTDWFAPQRVMNSTWTGIDDPSLLNLDVFTIQGLLPSRRFYINKYFGGCPNDPTILMVLTSGDQICPYDKRTSYPTIMYSVSNTWANPDIAAQVGYADSLMILIKTS